MTKRFIFTIITLLVIVLIAGLAIFFAKGFRISPTERRIVGTGIINISSEPDAASVFIDDHLTTSTNATISSLTPKNYSVRVVKEGFIPWEKQVTVREGLVSEVKVTLFPAIPTIYPLTFTSVVNPVLSPDGDKLAYIVPSDKKAGVWVWTMARNQPIAFARSSEPHQIVTSLSIDFSQANLRWSADSKQILASVGNQNWLLDADRLNTDPRDITATLPATLQDWEETDKEAKALLLETIKNLSVKTVASESGFLKWSPDETKFMVRKEPVVDERKDIQDMKVYDLEVNKEYSLPKAKVFRWLPNSKHVILVDENTISLVEYDGTNQSIIYAGSFQNSFVFPWPDSSRLVIVTSFPTPTASEPNLFGINLK